MVVIFEDRLTKVIHGRWQDHLDELDAADILITDPPYGMGYISNFSKSGSTDPIRGDRDASERDALIDAWRTTKPERPALVFGTWRVTRPSRVRELLVWHKLGGGLGDLSIPWGPSHEEIYVMGGKDPSNWTGKRESNVYVTGKRDGNATAGHLEHGHPTPKPVLLMQSLIRHTTGALIIDPFACGGR